MGKTTLEFTILDKEKNPFNYCHEFLIAHSLCGYQAQLGAEFLLDPSITVAITPDNLVVKPLGELILVPLFSQEI